ncbi:hypothetical protein, partial [Burkholderia cepacia]|uniref:hypothetical protein n=1 Tax=Burkholderia cepacia TaxID=292 RepID=UPI001E3AA6F4
MQKTMRAGWSSGFPLPRCFSAALSQSASYRDGTHNRRVITGLFRQNDRYRKLIQIKSPVPKETLINGPTSEVAGEMASNFLDDEA